MLIHPGDLAQSSDLFFCIQLLRGTLDDGFGDVCGQLRARSAAGGCPSRACRGPSVVLTVTVLYIGPCGSRCADWLHGHHREELFWVEVSLTGREWYELLVRHDVIRQRPQRACLVHHIVAFGLALHGRLGASMCAAVLPCGSAFLCSLDSAVVAIGEDGLEALPARGRMSCSHHSPGAQSVAFRALLSVAVLAQVLRLDPESPRQPGRFGESLWMWYDHDLWRWSGSCASFSASRVIRQPGDLGDLLRVPAIG